MPDPITIALISAFIAFAALAVSAVTLLRTDYAIADPVTVVGPLRHRIYPVKNGKEKWFISSFDAPVSFCNSGARPLLITHVRLRLHFPNIPIPGNEEIIFPRWDVDPTLAPRIDRNRFQWLEELAPRQWMSVGVLPKETVLKHLIFEVRWNDPVVQKDIHATLETQSSVSREWTRAARWHAQLDAETWGELSNNGTSMSYDPDGRDPTVERCTPADLHKYTGSKDPIPKEGFGAGTSYLDFPDGGNGKNSC